MQIFQYYSERIFYGAKTGTNLWINCFMHTVQQLDDNKWFMLKRI